MTRLRIGCAIYVFVALFACSTVPPDRGRSEIDALLAQRGFGAADATVSPLSDGALQLSEAILLALANNPDLAAEYAALGFSVADIDAAGRIGNPRVSLAYLFAGRSGDQDETGFELAQSFTALILMPSRKRLAQAEFERLQLRVAGSGQQLAYEVGVAWYDRVVARERAQEQARMAELARLSAELVARYVAAGNLEATAAAEARRHAAEIALDALAAESDERIAAVHFERLLGIRAPGGGWPLPAGMPRPPAAEPEAAEAAVAAADAGRLDLLAARRAVSRYADALGVTRRFRYLGDVELGSAVDWNDAGSRSAGPLMALELPVFDQGQGEVIRAEAALAQAEAELEALELDIAAELMRAQDALRIAEERYRLLATELLPAAREIVARTREKVDFMLASPFDLLAARQNEFTAIRDTLTAAGDYWQARMALARAGGQPPPDPTGLPTLQLLDDHTSASNHAEDAPARGAPQDDTHQHDMHHHDSHRDETPPNNGGYGAHR